MKKAIFLLLILISTLSCLKNHNELKDNRIIWESEYLGEKDASVRGFPLITKDKVIISRDDFFSQESALVAFDKKDGKKLWKWQKEYLIPASNARFKHVLGGLRQYENVIVGIDSKYMVGIDLETGNIIWENKFDYDFDNVRSVIYNSKIYYLGRNYSDNMINVIAIDPLSGNIENVVDIKSMYSGFNISNQGFHIFENDSNDICMLLGIYHVKNEFKPNEIEKYNLIKYNITKNEFDYKKEYDFTVGVKSFFIHNDTLFGDGDYFSTYDLKTGKLLSQFKEDVFTFAPYTCMFDYPYVFLMYNNLTNKFVKINMTTGKEIWRISLDGHQSYTMDKKDNRIFMIARNGKMYIIDSGSGTIIERVAAPYSSEDYYLAFEDYFSIDKETGYLYCSDFKHVFCYDFDK